MFAINPGESRWRQQDIFISTFAEDVALQNTLRLPVIVLTREKQVETDERQIITSTASSAAMAGVGNLISAALKYATNIVITNTFSQIIYGTYVTVFTSTTVISFTAMLGLDTTMVRFLSAYHAKNEHGLATGLIRFVITLTLISGLLCGALFYLFSTTIAHLVYHKDAYALPLKELSLLVPLVALQLVLASGLQALKAIKWKVYVSLIQPALSLILIGVFYLLGLGLEALILATICGFLASTIAGQMFLRKASRQYIRNAEPRLESKTWLRFALPISLNSLLQYALNSTDVLFLTAFASAAQVGLYAAADRVSSLIMIPSFALNVIFSPLIAEYYAREEHKQLANLSRLVTKWIFTLSWPLFLSFYVFHEAILSIFSQKYTEAGVALIILAFGNLIDAGVSSVGPLLVMTGKTRVVLADSIATIAINIGLGFWFVPRFGVLGTAIATTLTIVFLDIIAHIEVYWLLKIITLRWDMLKPVVAGLVACIVGLLLVRIIHVDYGYRAIIGTLGLITPFMLVYVLVLALLRFSKEDMMVIDAIRVKFAKKPSA